MQRGRTPWQPLTALSNDTVLESEFLLVLQQLQTLVETNGSEPKPQFSVSLSLPSFHQTASSFGLIDVYKWTQTWQNLKCTPLEGAHQFVQLVWRTNILQVCRLATVCRAGFCLHESLLPGFHDSWLHIGAGEFAKPCLVDLNQSPHSSQGWADASTL